MFFSFDIFSNIYLKSPLFLSTHLFLFDALAGRSFTDTLFPFRYFTKNGWKNSGSALKYHGASCIHIHTSSNFIIIFSASLDLMIFCSPKPVPQSDTLRSSRHYLLCLTVMKSAWTSTLKSSLICLRDSFLVYLGRTLFAHGMHGFVTLSMAFRIRVVNIPASSNIPSNSFLFPCIKQCTFLKTLGSGRFIILAINEMIVEFILGSNSTHSRSSPLRSFATYVVHVLF